MGGSRQQVPQAAGGAMPMGGGQFGQQNPYAQTGGGPRMAGAIPGGAGQMPQGQPMPAGGYQGQAPTVTPQAQFGGGAAPPTPADPNAAARAAMQMPQGGQQMPGMPQTGGGGGNYQQTPPGAIPPGAQAMMNQMGGGAAPGMGMGGMLRGTSPGQQIFQGGPQTPASPQFNAGGVNPGVQTSDPFAALRSMFGGFPGAAGAAPAFGAGGARGVGR